jgi:hypothetical protein
MPAVTTTIPLKAPLGLRVAGIMALVIGALALLVYPVFAVFGLISLTGYRSGNEPWSLLIVSRTFLFGMLLYPVVFIASLEVASRLRKRGEMRSAWMAVSAPAAYVLVLAALFQLWLVMSG